MANGSDSAAITHEVNTRIAFHDGYPSLDISLAVTPLDIDADIIIGADFMAKHKAVLDFNNGRMELQPMEPIKVSSLPKKPAFAIKRTRKGMSSKGKKKEGKVLRELGHKFKLSQPNCIKVPVENRWTRLARIGESKKIDQQVAETLVNLSLNSPQTLPEETVPTPLLDHGNTSSEDSDDLRSPSPEVIIRRPSIQLCEIGQGYREKILHDEMMDTMRRFGRARGDEIDELDSSVGSPASPKLEVDDMDLDLDYPYEAPDKEELRKVCREVRRNQRDVRADIKAINSIYLRRDGFPSPGSTQGATYATSSEGSATPSEFYSASEGQASPPPADSGWTSGDSSVVNVSEVTVITDDTATEGVTVRANLKLRAIRIHELNNKGEEIDPDEMEKEEIIRMIPEEYREYWDCFRRISGSDKLPPPREWDHKIELVEGAKLTPAPLYTMDPDAKVALREILDKELVADKIRPSDSPYASPAFLVPKSGGRWRLVIDYRKLNEATIKNAYPLPLINQIWLSMSGSRYFSKFDVGGAYQVVRMSPESEKYTTFRTCFGSFLSKVLRDGLCNAPGTFQAMMNALFAEVIGDGAEVYMDDFLLHAATKEKLKETTIKVLSICRANGIFLAPTKCEFARESVTFLGHIISADGLATDPEKVKSVREFPTPKTVKEVRSFLGMVGYYRKFIHNFSDIAKPLTDLTKQKNGWTWTEVYDTATEKLKTCLTEAPVLANFEPSHQKVIRSDASDQAWAYTINQIDLLTGIERPVIFDSGKFTEVELNYPIHDKELMPIVKACEKQRAMLIGVTEDILVYTDHHSLVYFMKTRMLSRRLIRWAQTLSEYRLQIIYQAGKTVVVPDILSRRPDYHAGKGVSVSEEHSSGNLRQLLPDFHNLTPEENEALRSQYIKGIRVIPNDQVDQPNRDYGIGILEMLEAQEEDDNLVALKGLVRERDEIEMEGWEGIEEVKEKIKGLAVRCAGREPDTGPWRITEDEVGILRGNDRIIVPNLPEVRIKIIRNRHESPLVRHPGIAKTVELLQRKYVWSGMGKDVEEFVKTCLVCVQTKSSRKRPKGLLNPIQVADGPSKEITLDIVSGLPEDPNGNTCLLVMVCRSTKLVKIRPLKSTATATQVAKEVFEGWVRCFGLPQSIISDRGPQFTSDLWKELWASLKVTRKLSTAYHPQTDGQSERMIQYIIQILRSGAAEGDKWWDILGQVEFAINSLVNTSTKFSPFFAMYGYNPRGEDDITLPEVIGSPTAEQIAKDRVRVQEELKRNIEKAQEAQKKQYDKRRDEAVSYQPGDKVMIDLTDYNRFGDAPKLAKKFEGPFEVLERVAEGAYRIKVPSALKIHDVLPTVKLAPYNTGNPIDNPLGNREQFSPTSAIILEVDKEYEVDEVLDSRKETKASGKRPRPGRVEYLIHFTGYSNDDDEWCRAEQIRNAEEKVEEFHKLHPNKEKDEKFMTKEELQEYRKAKYGGKGIKGKGKAKVPDLGPRRSGRNSGKVRVVYTDK